MQEDCACRDIHHWVDAGLYGSNTFFEGEVLLVQHNTWFFRRCYRIMAKGSDILFYTKILLELYLPFGDVFRDRSAVVVAVSDEWIGP